MTRFLNQEPVCFDSGSDTAAAAAAGGEQSNKEAIKTPYLIRGVPTKV